MIEEQKHSDETPPSYVLNNGDGRRWYAQILLALIELPVAFGVGWFVDYQFYEAVRRASGQELGMAGVMVSGLALGAGAIVAGIFYWLVVTTRNYRICLFMNAIAIWAILQGLVHPIAESKMLREKETAKAQAITTDAEAAYAAWVKSLQLSINHGPPGTVPPMLKVADDGISVRVQNIAQKKISVALARVRPDASAADGWNWCGMYTERPGRRYYYFSLLPGESATYQPYENCAEKFRDAPIEYRVGGSGGGMVNHVFEIGWWSDSAFAAIHGRK